MSDIVRLGKGEWAIKDGSVLAVRSVNDKKFYSLPFNFTRSSDATYVGRDGLVKNISKISSGELVTNGTFDTDSDWTKLNATISGGKGNLDGNGQTSMLWQDILSNGNSYKAIFTVSDYNGSGSAKIINNNASTIYTITSNGTFTIYFTHSIASGNFIFRATSGAVFSIDNVSVKEGLVSNGNFTNSGTLNNGTYSLGWTTPDTGLSISNGVLNLVNNGAAFPGRAFLANGTNNYQYLNGAKNYYLKYRVHANTSSASLTYYNGNSYISIDGSVGEHEFYFKAGGNLGENNKYFVFRNSSSNTTIELDDVFLFQVDDADLPRIDFTDNVNGDLLLEPQSTNLITYSEDFLQSFWNNTYGEVISDNLVSAPDGSISAQKWKRIAGTYNLIRPAVNITGADKTLSVFVKNISADNFYLRDTSGFYFYNFSSQTVSNSNLKVEQYPNGWVRLSTSNTNDNFKQFGIGENETDNTELNNEVYIWGAQLEALSYPTSYIRTNGIKATRLKDKCWNTGTQHDFDSSEGVLYYEAKFAKTGQTGLITIGDANGSPFLLLGHTGSVNTPKLYFDINTGAGSIISPNSAKSDTAINIDNVNKVALSWSPTGYKVYVNGVLAHEENKQINMGTTTYGVLNNIYMGYSSSSFLYGNLKELKVYKKAMSASELVALTS